MKPFEAYQLFKKRFPVGSCYKGRPIHDYAKYHVVGYHDTEEIVVVKFYRPNKQYWGYAILDAVEIAVRGPTSFQKVRK